MGLSLSDLIPNEVKSVAEVFTKPLAKATNKLMPNELRFLAPYASAAGSVMLPPGMGPWMRAMLAAGLNVAGQTAADEEATGEIDDLNLISTALAGGIGALGSKGMGARLRGGIDTGIPPEAAMARGPAELGMTTRGTGFLQGAENLGREGLAQGADYLTGAREGLASLGTDPGSLFKYEADNLINKLPGLAGAAKDMAPILTHGTADLAKASSDKYTREFERQEAADAAEIEATSTANEGERATLQMTFMRQAGHDEETIKETLAQNDLSEYYEPPVTAAQGGIIGLKNGGMLNLGGNEMDYRGGGFVPIGKRERADDVPARLSKNEFVMTADAVKAAGGGSVNKGAQRMYNVMNNLEARA